MPVNNREIIEAVSIISANHDIKVCIKSSVKASAIVAGTTFVGAFVSFESFLIMVKLKIILSSWVQLVSQSAQLLEVGMHIRKAKVTFTRH